MTSLCSLTQEAELLFHVEESASNSTGLFLNPSKTNTCISTRLLMIVYTRQMGVKLRKVEDFKYFRSYTNSQHDIQCTKALLWDEGRTDPDIWVRFIVANRNCRKCTEWRLHKVSKCMYACIGRGHCSR